MTSKLQTCSKNFMIGFLVVAMGGSTSAMAAPIVFSDFTTGTAISSSDMNTKLNALKGAVNASRLVSVPSTGFATTSDSGTATDCRSERGPYAYFISGIGCFASAPVSLLDGATITVMDCLAYDNSATVTNFIQAALYRVNLYSGLQEVVSFTPATSNSAGNQLLQGATTAANALVDNSVYAYRIETSWGTGDLSLVGGRMRLYGCYIRITP